MITSDLVQAARGRVFGVPAGLLMGGLVAVAALTLLLPLKLVVLLALVGVVGLVLATRVDLAVAVYVFVVFTEASHVAVERAGFTLLAELVVGLVLLAHLGDGRAARTRSGAARTVLAVLPFMLWSVASFFWAEIPIPVLGRFSDNLRYLAITIVLVAAIRTQRTFRFAVWGIIASGAFLGSVAVLQVLTRSTATEFFFGFGGSALQGLGTGEFGNRVVGPIGDANFFAQRMVIVLPFAIERTIHERRRLPRLLAAGTVLVTLATIVFTYSRGGAIAAGVVVVASLVHFLSLRRALVVMGVVAAAALLVVPSSYVDRVVALRGITEVGTTSETSVKGRTSAILVGLHMFEEHPLLGVGSLQYPLFYGDYAKGIGLDPEVGRAPHNLYLEIASENGLVGVVLFGWMLVAAASSATSATKRLREAGLAEAAELVWATRTALAGYLVASLFLHYAAPRAFFALIAMCFAAPFLVELHAAGRRDADDDAQGPGRRATLVPV